MLSTTTGARKSASRHQSCSRSSRPECYLRDRLRADAGIITMRSRSRKLAAGGEELFTLPHRKLHHLCGPLLVFARRDHQVIEMWILPVLPKSPFHIERPFSINLLNPLFDVRSRLEPSAQPMYSHPPWCVNDHMKHFCLG